MRRLSQLLCSLALTCSAVAVAVADRADGDAHSMAPYRHKLGLATQMANGVVSLLSASLHFAPEGPLPSRDEGLDEPEDPATDEEMVASTWCASGVLAHDGVVCCDKTCGQCGGDNCASLPGGAEHCCLAIIESMAIPCSSYTDTACLLPEGVSGSGAQSSSTANATTQLTSARLSAIKANNKLAAEAAMAAAAAQLATGSSNTPSEFFHAVTEAPQSVKKPSAENNSSGLGDTLDPLDTGVGRDEGASDQAANASNATEPTTAEAMVAARAAEVAAARLASTWCASGWLAHDGVVCCDKTCGQCGGDNCASLPGGAEHCCLAIIESMAIPCSSYTDTACLLPPPRWLAQENVSSARAYFG